MIKPNWNLHQFQMINKKILIIILLCVLLNNCSFDNKTGLWDGEEEEREAISKIEEEQNQVINVRKIFSGEEIYSKEILLNQSIVLSEAKKNTEWKMSNLNNQNFLGNIYLSSVDNVFLKKKRGKNKFSQSKILASPLIYKNNIIYSDQKGTIFNINLDGKINWKKNIYKKIYNKIYKNLNFIVNKNIIYISDNIGFVYAISLDSGALIWIKNHGIPLRSNIKIFNNKIFLVNQDNRFLCLNIKDGSLLWNFRSISSFIKFQNLLSLAISDQGNVVGINSSGEIFNIDSNNGRIIWSKTLFASGYENTTNFIKFSEIVIDNVDIVLSVGSSTFSINLKNGFTNWQQQVSSIAAPILVKKNIFLITDNGYFVVINKDSGKIISSTNILKILKKRRQKTKISGFIMGSEKFYAVTLNGYLIVSSAITGKVEYFKKIGDPITTSPIINNGKLYILTKNSRIFGFN